MFEKEEEKKPLIDQPVNNKKTPAKPEQDIFVMPEKYRGGAEGKLHQPVKPKPKPVVQPLKPPPPLKPPVPPKKKLPIPKKKKFPTKLVIFGVVVIALFGAGAVYLLSTIEPATTEPIERPPIIIPDPDPLPDPDPVPDPDPLPDPDPDPEDPFAFDLTSGTDSDSDGLTDIEELIYGTNPRLPDTDSDGFLDGNEVFHRYNPSGDAPASLFESGIISVFDDPDYSYSIFYPSAWNVRLLGGEEEQSMFTASSGEVVQVMRQDKPVDQLITDWFLEQDTQAAADQLLQFSTKEELTGVMSPDRMTAYLDSGTSVFIINYTVGTKPTVEYLQTFQMMLNSLILR